MFFFKNYKNIVFIAVLLIVAFIILFHNMNRKSSVSLVDEVVLEVAVPIHDFLNTSIENVRNSWRHYLLLIGIEEENKHLRKKIDELKAQLILYQEGYQEAQRLRSLFALKEVRDFNFVIARVVGREQALMSKTILINKGTSHGLNAGQPVIAASGLVGRVISTSWHSAKVLPLIDENSNIDAIVQRTRIQGIIRGAGTRGCVLKYVSKTQDVQEGDIVVSSGIGGVFPKGLIIGQVSHVNRREAGLFWGINITPSVDFSKLEEVVVITSKDNENESGQ